jgi:phosphatidate cytidylyltransferase
VSAATQRWRDLRLRALSAAVLAPAAIACVWAGGLPWTVLMAAALALLAWEWVRLCGFSTARLPGLVVPPVVLAAAACTVLGASGLALVVIMAGAMLAWGLGRLPAFRPAVTPAWLALGVLQIGLAGVALLRLRGDGAVGLGNVVFLFLLVWASDIGAYLTGRILGGPKLAARISPNKTWSGAAGGLFFAMAVGGGAAYAMTLAPTPGSLLRAALVAGLLGVTSQLGDLFESWMKRRFGVKDSSNLIPGHGGLLDRLDGMLTAAPAAALLVLLLGEGLPLWH